MASLRVRCTQGLAAKTAQPRMILRSQAYAAYYLDHRLPQNIESLHVLQNLRRALHQELFSSLVQVAVRCLRGFEYALLPVRFLLFEAHLGRQAVCAPLYELLQNQHGDRAFQKDPTCQEGLERENSNKHPRILRLLD